MAIKITMPVFKQDSEKGVYTCKTGLFRTISSAKRKLRSHHLHFIFGHVGGLREMKLEKQIAEHAGSPLQRGG